MPEASAPEPAPAPDRSRREVLSRSGTVLAGAAAMLAGCSSKVTPPSNVPLSRDTPGAPEDILILNHLLRLERLGLVTYAATIPLLDVAAGPELHPAPGPPAPPSTVVKPLSLVPPLSAAAASAFLAQEIQHVFELRGLIKQAGGTPAHGYPHRKLGQPKNKDEVLALLYKVKLMQVRGYHHATVRLTPARLRAAAAAIFCAEAQQLVVLRLELRVPPIPSAFVTGRV